MTELELKKMTVLQLRKVAKENGVVLGAGIDKAGIIDKLLNADQSSPEDVENAASEASVSTDASPRFQAAWHNTDAPQHNAAHPSASFMHPSWQNSPVRPSSNDVRPQPSARPMQYQHRFGPGAAPAVHPASESDQHAEPSRHMPSPLPERRVSFSTAETHSFGPRPSSYPAAGDNRPYEEPQSQPPENNEASAAPSLEELLASGDYEEGGGILELHPDGYGFLRASSFLPSTRDVYVSMAQIRRFGLRTGDYVSGKIRPQREGDKYSALLYISTVNDLPEEEALNRPVFDELTPTYPSRRMSLESVDGKSLSDMRLVDLIAPLGFGQRALLLCPPGTGKNELLRDFAKVICSNYPDVQTLMLLIDVNPEDATLIRDQVPCPVLSSAFDQPPESHLRLSEIVLERAMRLVEQKKDVVLIVDSLTRLAKVYTTAAAQQGRSLPGMVNPASLFRAKRLFGAARSCKEGGSLTVIAAMDIATGSKVDDSVVEEFKGTANMELTLDLAVSRAGIIPALNLSQSYTKNADILLDDRQKEGLSLIRQLLGNTSSSVAIPQLLSMMEKTDTNADLLIKMKDWFALMNR